LNDGYQGYLIGLNFGGIIDFAPLPENVREVTKGPLEIARAGIPHELEVRDKDEHAYAELPVCGHAAH